MKLRNALAAAVWATWTVLASPQAWSGEGHDHGDEAPAGAVGSALPRFAAVSETFELVGVVNGRHITLYLDRFADGSPVKDARLELALGGARVPVEAHAEGEFEAELAQNLTPGVIAVAATVIAGQETDLLAGELDLHDEHVGEAPSHPHDWQAHAMWILMGGLGAIAGLTLLRRLRGSRRPGSGGAA